MLESATRIMRRPSTYDASASHALYLIRRFATFNALHHKMHFLFTIFLIKSALVCVENKFGYFIIKRSGK